MQIPHSALITTAVLISTTNESKGMAIKAEPNPVSPCRKLALKKISGTRKYGDMVNPFQDELHGAVEKE